MTVRRASGLDIATALLVLALVGLALQVAVFGPAGPLPMHFDLSGRPDRWGDRGELALLLAVLALIAGGVAGGLGWTAGRCKDPSRRRGLKVGQFVVLFSIAATAALVFTTILGTSGVEASLKGAPVMGLLGFLLAGTGAVLGRIAPNVFVGVRTPWAYKSRIAWDRSNRLAGRLFFGLGLLAIVSAPFAPQPAGMVVLGVAVVLALAGSMVESWRVWRADPDRQPF